MANRPGANRPGIGGGNGNVGSGNIGAGNTTVNRPNFGGNTVVNNNNNNNNNFVNNNTSNNFNRGNNNWGGGTWGGGGTNWGRGGWDGGYGNGGGGGWNGPGYGYGYGGWSSPYYGNWYRGGWGNNGFWTGFGLGAFSSFGLGGLGSVLTSPGYAYSSTLGYPVGSYGVYDYFPTWGVSNYSSWGVGSMASTALYSGYTNPYYAQVVAAQPPQTTIIYNYAEPINVAAAPPEAAVATTAEELFSAARDAFKAGDYARALDQADQVLQQTPNVPVVHEFRSLTLFALKRYDEAASVIYSVLTAGPGWNWATLVGLYADVETYTNQLRALEAYRNTNPSSATATFLLAYHYMVQGHVAEAAREFDKVVKLEPNDQLSSSFSKVLRKSLEPQPEAAQAIPAQAVAAAPAQPQPQPAPAQVANPPAAGDPVVAVAEAPPPPPPPPAALVGVWTSAPSVGVAIVLTLKEDGAFIWDVDTKGQKQTLEGTAGFKDGTLALLQAEGPPLVGKIVQTDANSFEFRPPNAPATAPGLKFTR